MISAKDVAHRCFSMQAQVSDTHRSPGGTVRMSKPNLGADTMQLDRTVVIHRARASNAPGATWPTPRRGDKCPTPTPRLSFDVVSQALTPVNCKAMQNVAAVGRSLQWHTAGSTDAEHDSRSQARFAQTLTLCADSRTRGSSRPLYPKTLRRVPRSGVRAKQAVHTFGHNIQLPPLPSPPPFPTPKPMLGLAAPLGRVQLSGGTSPDMSTVKYTVFEFSVMCCNDKSA